ncbi:MAG: DUF4430 domain-containing protein, partial [Candidatus Yanofskybacteria bacterium]|nr:DUF4430 domain-containing protein [Candidatus Yanofskybacteria bacterium]
MKKILLIVSFSILILSVASFISINSEKSSDKAGIVLDSYSYTPIIESKNENQPAEKISVVPASSAVAYTEAPSLKQETQVADTISNSSDSVNELININFVAGDFSRSFKVPSGSTAYDAMLVLASTTNLTFKSEYYSGLGYFVKEINGKPNSGGTYWTLYVNGKYSMIGTSQYKLQPGDAVEWKYEKQ